jgi:amino acid adenylation domain-containing protein
MNMTEVEPKTAGSGKDDLEFRGLSFAQKRLWFLDQLGQGSNYNVPLFWRISGSLNVDALVKSLKMSVERHQVLRTAFSRSASGPDARLLPADLFDVGTVHAIDADIPEKLIAFAEAPFMLDKELPIRAQILKVADADHVLCIVVHHIAFDSWSESILADELALFYEKFAAGIEPEPAPLTIQYDDYAQIQYEEAAKLTEKKQLHEAYWRDALADAPPALELPLDRPRAQQPELSTGRTSIRLNSDVRRALLKLGRENGCTLFMTLLASTHLLMSRWSGSSDISIGTPIANRNRREFEGLIGFFVNMLVLRMKLDPDMTVVALLKNARRVALDAFAHQDVPFERLVEMLQPTRVASVNPLFQVSLVLQKSLEGVLKLAGLEVEPIDMPEGAKFDLTFFFTEMADGDLKVECEFNGAIFDTETVERMVGHLGVILGSMVAAPDCAIGRLPMLTEDEHAQFDRWNSTEFPLQAKTIHDVLCEVAERHPESPALVYRDQSMTYGELLQRSDRLARSLISLGAGPEKTVALFLPSGIDLIVALWAVLRSGAAFLPLETANPDERIGYMLADAGSTLAITSNTLAHRLLRYEGLALLRMDGDAFCEPAFEGPLPRVAPDALAYVTYTSGSTGQPKGVAMHHAPVVNLIQWHLRTFGGSNRTAQFTSIGFDISNHEIFTALGGGGTLILFDDDVRRDPHALVEALNSYRADALFLPFSVLALLAATGMERGIVPPLKSIFCGGEPVELTDSLVRWIVAMPGCRLYNHYGLTETHVVMSHTVELSAKGDHRPVPIGLPMDNVELYVLDPELQLVPVGVAGELYIGGIGQARCYWGKPGITAARYVPNPFEQGERFCRTGDLVRRRPNGEIEFIGRLDNQVKLRGFRIELGEIEAALLDQPSIAVAAAIVREDRPGDRRLVAYVKTDNRTEPDLSSLRQALSRRLPDYMLPQSFVFLDELPFTSNGKLDKAALPPPQGKPASTPVDGPTNALEAAIHWIFCDILGNNAIGIHDNFFALGGHSLLATQVVTRLRSSLECDISLREFFDNPTIAGLAALRSARSEKQLGTDPIERPQWLPLSFAQRRLFFLDRLRPDATYNIPMYWELQGALNVAALCDAFLDIVSRHEILRTTYPIKDGDPYQNIVQVDDSFIEYYPVPLPRSEIDLRLSDFSKYKFDLSFENPLVTKIYLSEDGAWFVAILVHHIAFDGWSEPIFLDELAEIYDSKVSGRASQLPPLTLQYADFALRQHNQYLSQDQAVLRDLDYWREALRGAPPLVELPLARPRSIERVQRTGNIRFRLDRDVGEGIERQAQLCEATPFIIIYVALSLLLARYSCTDDIVIGAPVANRTVEEIEPLIGFFVNTLPLSLRLRENETLRALIKRGREAVTDGFSHQNIPFDLLVEKLETDRIPGVNPLFQVALVLQSTTGQNLRLRDLQSTRLPAEGAAKFDVTFAFEKGREGLYICDAEFDASILDEETVERICQNFQTTLAGISRNIDREVSSIEILSEAERGLLLEEWSNRARSTPTSQCVHSRFGEIVEKNPEAIALVHGGLRLSYRELDLRANRLAHDLVARGIRLEDRVGLHLHRSVAQVVAILAVLKSGAAYVPLDPNYPADRIDKMLSVSNAKIVLQDATDQGREFGRATGIVLDEAFWEGLSRHPDTAPQIPVQGQNLAYVMFTSGSTGEPKGIGTTHANIVHYTVDNDAVVLRPTDVSLHMASFAFDGSTSGILGTLLNGARLVLYPEGPIDPQLVGEIIRRESVSFIMFPTALFHAMVDNQPEALAPLRLLLIGGDVLSSRAVSKLRSISDCQIINGYGPTEATVCAIHYDASAHVDSSGPLPIGLPMNNVAVYLLDRNMRPVPIGATGDLYIGGDGVSRGYVGNVAATAASFVPNPFGQGPGRLYRTGDQARYRNDGMIEFIGRADRQLKVRGFRVEPAEIEMAIERITDVAQALVLPERDSEGATRLRAFVVVEDDKGLSAEAVKSFLASELPEFMIPAAITLVDSFPVNSVGKIDQASLLSIPQRLGTNRRDRRFTPIENALAATVSEVLGVNSVSLDDGFFASGGHSLRAMKLSALMKQRYDIELPVMHIFKHQTIRSMAAALAQKQDVRALLAVALNDSQCDNRAFLSHPVSGTLTAYYPLAASIRETWNLWGLQSPLLVAGSRSPQSLYDIASDHAEAIRKVQPDGPYTLCGWSFGGVLAVATASILEESGCEVEHVLALDPAYGDTFISDQDDDIFEGFVEMLSRFNGLAPIIGVEAAGAGTHTERVQTLAAALAQHDADFDSDEVESMFDLYSTHLLLARKFHPATISADLTVVFAHHPQKSARRSQWSGVSKASTRFVDMTCDHFEILKVAPLSDLLARRSSEY